MGRSSDMPPLVALVLVVPILVLPLMLPVRTPELMATSGVILLVSALLATALALFRPIPADEPQRTVLPARGWWLFLVLMSGAVLLQVLPFSWLARTFGPYPDVFWSNPFFEPGFWSPNPAATLRAWAIFMALFAITWLVHGLDRQARNYLWLAVVASALFQAGFGLVSQLVGAETVFGIWERRSTNFIQGSFSNRNLFAAYLALAWPLSVAVWWIRDMPGLSKLPKELRVTGSLVSSALLGAAIFTSASRLGAMGASIGAVTALLLLTSYRGRMPPYAIWPAWLALLGAFLLAVWMGLEPLADRLAISEADGHRRIAFELMLTDLPLAWWLHGTGLGGFEAVFKLIQPDQIGGWWDYAHSDVLQWLLEMGVVGLVLVLMVAAALARQARLSLERIALYGGLTALLVVATADFSWHMPATQVVLAAFIGTLLRPAGVAKSKPVVRPEAASPGRTRRRRKRRRAGDLRPDLID